MQPSNPRLQRTRSAPLAAEPQAVRPTVISDNAIRREILQEGLHDHIGLWSLLWHFQDLPDSALRRRKTMALVETLLGQGWFEAGFPTSDGRGFEPWSSALDVSIARVDKEWDALGREPNIGEIVWFNLTPAGETEARKHVARA